MSDPRKQLPPARRRPLRPLWLATLATLSLALAVPALAAGGGGGGGGGGAGMRSSSSKQRAMDAYKKGERARIRGIELLQEAAAISDPEAKQHALNDANRHFKRALREYRKATRRDRRFHQAYNGVGFSERMLGNYEAALEAYDRALKLEPDFPQAIEYRGEAYLRLGRLDQAKEAYMQLFADHRKLADMLMGKMQAWLAEQRDEPGPVPADQLDAFAQWVQERSQIAEQTAALTGGAEPETW